MKNWKDFLDSLDTTGGHILIFLVILILGAVACLILAVKGHAAADNLGNFLAMTVIPTFFAILRGTGKANGRTLVMTRASDLPATEPPPNSEAR